MGAGNEWINGYLEAILDVGSSKGRSGLNLKLKNQKKMNFEDDDDDDGFEKKSTTSTYEVKPFNPTNYFVEEVVNSFDESDLYHTWIKVIATKNTRERNNRLENMCWRIWHLTRRKKQIALENTHGRGLSRRNYLERTCGTIHDASEDLSDLSEGEKERGGEGNPVPSSSDNNNKIPRINSDMKIWSEDDDKPRRLYIVLISVHGLVRGENMELGRDSDTGGQYVVELARALANMSGVYRVDLLTRQITSLELNSSYGEPIEMLSCPSDATDSCGAYIIRIPCGPLHKYIPKESLWPYIPEFIDGSLSHIVNMSRALGEQIQGPGKPTWPYVIHGHYADSGEVAAYLSGVLNVPMVLTGHSLGRNKLEQLLKQGRLTSEVINSTYKISRRIEAEELGLDAAEMVVTSTRQEIEEQWGLYDGFDFKLQRKLRVRRRRSVSCLGRYMPRMVVIPPGMDFSYVTNQDTIEGDGDLKSLIGSDRGNQTKRTIPQIWSEVMRFFTNPHKPMILALSRPDPKKNVTTLLKAYGECPPLRELANLTLILGNREDIEEMTESSSVVLTNVLKLIDKYDLYGQVAYPKHHNQSEVPEIYRLAAKTKGVFINPALVEPFGLTLIEAAAYALPIVATKNGGPVDIIKALNNGLLVDPHDHKAIAEALLKLVSGKNLWFDCRKNGLKNIHRFSWPEHCRNYLSHVEHCRNRHLNTRLEITQIQEEEPMSDSLKDVDDLSLKFSIDSDTDPLTRQKELIEAFTHRTAKAISYCPGRRQRLFIVAADCYDREGCCTEMLAIVIKNLKEAAAILGLNNIGLILLTGLTLQEVKEEVRLEDFDAVICSNGSEMCYPWKEDCSSTITADVEYEAHIEYRWPGENVKSIITRLGGAEDNDIVENPKAFSSRCFSYCIKPGSKTTRIDELRKRLRKRGLRCNPIYTCAASRLNVIPLLASRIQALRYLSVKWGIELSSMVVFTGDKGDTDYKDVLEGLHKTVILPGITEYGSELLLSSTGESCVKEDEGTGCICLAKAQTHEVNGIIVALKTLRFI